MSDLVTKRHDWPANKIRSTFIDYFKNHAGHEFYASCPVVPLDDPTLLFINAGMNQYKPIFLGQVDPNHPMAKLTRATNSQKCIRAGGKHNDLDDVGKDVYHHTFFEMLGSWSFGSYFKAEAIEWSFHLLTRVYGLDPERLYASYFGGDATMQLEADVESRDLWLRYLPASRVLPFDAADNFWEMGDTGPCGPCSEIHYDRIGNRDAAARVNADVADVIEIWNLVFIQYNRHSDGSLTPLPFQHVDTGMGFERLASILQGVDSNYDTDIFTPLFTSIQTVIGCGPYTGAVDEGQESSQGKFDMAYRVVADHIRTLVIAITDGAVPSNEGRGYVLRRILRRAVRYGQQVLGATTPFLGSLVPSVVTSLSEAFPNLILHQAHVTAIIDEEEASFAKTLSKGIVHFNKMADAVVASSSSSSTTMPPSPPLVLAGADAFFLYDTMGFPVDLTQLMAAERGLSVDLQGFQQAMTAQATRSKQDRKGLAPGERPLVLEAAETAALVSASLSPTDDAMKYDVTGRVDAILVALYSLEAGIITDRADPYWTFKVPLDATQRVGLIVSATSFYAQGGGQIYDTGVMDFSPLNTLNPLTPLIISRVEKFAGYVLHETTLPAGFDRSSLLPGTALTTVVNMTRRAAIAPNHTMTHVLNRALDGVLGQQTSQRGSLVDDLKMRFDFTNAKALKTEQLVAVEAQVNQIIAQALPVYVQTAPLAVAQTISGLTAVFGETYPENVRVVSIGQPIAPMLASPDDMTWKNYSVEFCGGTHLTNTSDAQAFVLYEETAVAKGIRRISACTGVAAVEAQARGEALLAEIKAIASCEDAVLEDTLSRVRPSVEASLLSLSTKAVLKGLLDIETCRLKNLLKVAMVKRVAQGKATARQAALEAAEASQAYVIVSLEVGIDAKLGRDMLEAMTVAYPRGNFCLVTVDPVKGKTACFVHVSPESVMDAREWVNATLAPLEGKGGGKDLKNATGQAKRMDAIPQALKAARAFTLL